ncbi:MAG: PA domain-containing protein [Flavobacteriales bacterium]
MKISYIKKLFLLISTIFFIVLYVNYDTFSTTIKRVIHAENLENSPFKETYNLTKVERKKIRLPPNKYSEKMWELSMNPIDGRPNIEKLFELQYDLRKSRIELAKSNSVPGESEKMKWVSRGPGNVGGRTKGMMFDPNDNSDETVFAGGVSGGLFKNTSISDQNSEWIHITNGIPSNIPVSSITYDPNDTKIIYVGTGESYTGAEALGNGLWKSSDGGVTWSNIFGGKSDSEQVYISEGNSIKVTNIENVGPFNYVAAAFGPSLTKDPIVADLLLADDGDASGDDSDGIGGITSDACQGLTAENASSMNGKVALIDRGDCSFISKVKVAQDAGAKAVIVINRNDGSNADWTQSPIVMGGTEGAGDITIPSVMISTNDGNKLKQNLKNGIVTVSLSQQNLTSKGTTVIPGIFYINDVVVRDNSGNSEIYIAVGVSSHRDAASHIFGVDDYGIWKSLDQGTTWIKVPAYLDGSTTLYQPMDLELHPSNNKLWFSTTNNFKGTGGGTILVSNSGVTSFVKKYTIENARRTELEIASNGTIYALAAENPVTIIKSSDEFSSAPTVITLPNDADGNITSDDFTRGQSFYDLLIESDPNNPNAIFAGGIDLFKSTTAAENSAGANPWNQLSHWYAGFGQPYAHADQHGAAFGNFDSSKKVFGNDGGVYFSKTQSDGSELMASRVNNYVTSQFYTIGVAPYEMFKDSTEQVSGTDSSTRLQSTLTISGITDVFLAGAQDNGTQLLANKNNSISRAHDVSGGDGAASMFSQNLSKRYYVTNYVYNKYVDVYSFDTNQLFQINSETSSNGDFITVQALDSKLGVIYSNYSNSGNYEIAAYYGWDNFSEADRNTNAPKIILKSAQMLANVSALTVSPFGTDTSTLMVGLENGSVFKVENANSNAAKWTNISGNEFLGSVSDIEFGINENEIFVTFHNYAVKNVFYSSDGGTTWSNKEGDLPDLPVRSILQNPIVLSEVIIGTDLGVWYTKNFKDESPTWIQGFNGMSDVRVTDLDLRDDYAVFAATYGRGVFSSYFSSDGPMLQLNSPKSSIKISQGDEGTFKVKYRVFSAYNAKTEFSITGLPINSSVDYIPSKKIDISESGEISIKLTIDENTEAKTYPLQIVATASGQTIDPVGISLEVLSNDFDNDGIKNVDDNCPNTANADQKDFDGDGFGDVCDPNPLPSDTFALEHTDETCRSSDNGSIKITIKGDFSLPFTVTVTGGPTGFTHTPESITGSDWSLGSLKASAYKVCLTSNSFPTLIQDFNITIEEPLDLSVLSTVNREDKLATLNLEGGTKYNILLNGNLITTYDDSIDLSLSPGINTIKVTTNLECQGVYEETIFVSENILLSPNPANATSKLWVGGNDKDVNITLFDITGRVIWTKNDQVPYSRSVDVSFSSIKSGLYILKVNSETINKTIKVIRE